MQKDSRRARLLQKIAVALLLALLLANIVLIFSRTASWRRDGAAPAAPGAEAVTLTYALSSLANSPLERCLAAQGTESVSWEPLYIAPDEYNDTLNRLLLAGQGPDLFELSQLWLDSYRYKGWLLPLEGRLGEGVEQLLAAAGNAEPDAVPTQVRSLWLLTNLSLLESCGFAQPPADWDEMAAVAAEVSRRQAGYGKYGFLFPLQKSPEEAYSQLEQLAFSAGLSNYDPASYRFRLESIRPVLDALLAMKATGGLSVDYPLSTFSSCLAQFIEGNIGMQIATLQDLAAVRAAAPDFAWTVSLPPAAGGSRGCAECLAGYLVVNRSSRDRVEALLPKIFTRELFAAVGGAEGFLGLAEASAPVYGAFGQGDVRPVWYAPENNRYTYPKFALYQAVFEQTGDYAALAELSASLSLNEIIRR